MHRCHKAFLRNAISSFHWLPIKCSYGATNSGCMQISPDASLRMISCTARHILWVEETSNQIRSVGTIYADSSSYKACDYCERYRRRIHRRHKAFLRNAMQFFQLATYKMLLPEHSNSVCEQDES